MRAKLLLIVLTWPILLFGQNRDSLQQVSAHDFLKQVLSNHPVARQALLLPEIAQQEILMAKGLFDPTVSAKYGTKNFQGTDYYEHFDSKLTLPVWLGELQAGYETNGGQYLNPERKTPANGLSAVGVSIPLLQGLFTDERRATLQQAKLLEPLAEAEKIKVINKLLLDAAKAYWDWTYDFYKFDLLSQAYDLADFRLNATKSRVLNGDLPPFDTLDALAQVQNLDIQRSQALVDLQNSALKASAYLWDEQEQPVQLVAEAAPVMDGIIEKLDEEKLNMLRDLAMSNHPEIRKNELKLKELDVERRYAMEKLKPKLNLEYNFLQGGFMLPRDVDFQSSLLPASSKIGVQFSVPLLLREARGKYGVTRAKISQTALEQKQLRRDIANEISVIANELANLGSQIRNQELLVANYSALLRGEQTRFENGESSLFLINSRQQQLLNSQIKLYEFKTKYAKSKMTLQWASGVIEINL